MSGKNYLINLRLTASNETAGVSDVPFRFGVDDDGNYGYIVESGGADTLIPFKSQEDIDNAVNQAIAQYRCKYLGQFNGATTINVTGLGATSSGQFKIMPVNSDVSAGMDSSIYNVMYSYLRLGAPTLNGNSLYVSASQIQIRVTGNVDRSAWRNINYQVWYIPSYN